MFHLAGEDTARPTWSPRWLTALMLLFVLLTETKGRHYWEHNLEILLAVRGKYILYAFFVHMTSEPGGQDISIIDD